MSEQLTNGQQTTVALVILAADPTIQVASHALPWPQEGQFRILIDSELLLVTDGSVYPWPVTRGIEGTTAAGHLLGATVSQILTAGSLVQTPVYWGCAPALAVPPAGSFAWFNQNTASFSIVNGRILLTVPQLAGDNMCIREKAIPHAPPWTVTVMISASVANIAFSNAGVCVRDSISGHLCFYGLVGDRYAQAITGAGTATAWAVSGTAATGTLHTPFMVKIVDDGVNISFSMSAFADGVNFSNQQQFTVAGFPNPPDKVGFFVDSENSLPPVTLTLYSWVET